MLPVKAAARFLGQGVKLWQRQCSNVSQGMKRAIRARRSGEATPQSFVGGPIHSETTDMGELVAFQLPDAKLRPRPALRRGVVLLFTGVRRESLEAASPEDRRGPPRPARTRAGQTRAGQPAKPGRR